MRRYPDVGVMAHSVEVGVLTSLLIDLKLKELGREPASPITMERLEEATKALGEISRCRKQVYFR